MTTGGNSADGSCLPNREKLYSIGDLARLSGKSGPSISRQIRNGNLAATRVSFIWVIRQADAERWLAGVNPKPVDHD